MLNFTDEIWKPVTGFEGYYWISNMGRVKNKEKIMKTYIINSGYLAIDFRVNKVRTKNLVHRLVAQEFCDTNDKEGRLEVNHIDGDKTNNNMNNLEWCTSSENKKHALDTGLKEYNYPTKGLKHKSNASKFHNVGKDKRGKWVATVRHNNKNWYQKRFDDEIEAAKHVNWILDQLGLDDRPRNDV